MINGSSPTCFYNFMLLSNSDKIKFKFLYMEKSHKELAAIFETNIRAIHVMAKEMGIFVSDWDKDIEIEYKKKTTP